MESLIVTNTLNNPTYNLFPFGNTQQCTSFVANIVNNVEPSLSIPGLSPNKMITYLKNKDIEGHKSIGTYENGIMRSVK